MFSSTLLRRAQRRELDAIGTKTLSDFHRQEQDLEARRMALRAGVLSPLAAANVLKKESGIAEVLKDDDIEKHGWKRASFASEDFDDTEVLQKKKRMEDALQDEEKRQAHEFLLLQEMIPKVLLLGRYADAEGSVICFLNNYPKNADAFVLLAEVYTMQGDYMHALEALWGALHHSPGNRVLLRLIRETEEACLTHYCRIPRSYKLLLNSPSLELYAPLEGPLAAFSESEAPFFVVKHGLEHVALANRAMKPGEIIFRQKPFVCTPIILPTGQVYTSCFHCLQDRPSPDRGYSCPVRPYTCPFVFCSWKCLMQSARTHALECQVIPILLAAAKESGLSVTTVVHIYRTLAKASMEEKMSDGDQRDTLTMLMKLNSYYKSVTWGQKELFEKLTLLARRLLREFPPFLTNCLTETELVKLMMILWQYSPFVTSSSAAKAVRRKNPEAAIGQVLCPLLGTFHHSCVPTCVYSLDEDGYMTVRALTEIPTGGKLCVSMVENLYSAQNERKGLQSLPRVFGCGCSRCTDPTEGGRYLRGIRCFKCVRGFLCPNKSEVMQQRLAAYRTLDGDMSKASVFVPPLSQPTPLKDDLDYFGSDYFDDDYDENSEEDESKWRQRKSGTSNITDPSPKQDLLETEGLSEDPHNEEWFCSACGVRTCEISRKCLRLERDIRLLENKAERALLGGDSLIARRFYTDIIEMFSSSLHPQHVSLYNAQVILAGLLSHEPAKNLPHALLYLRRAAVSAEAVLPICDMEKVHIYSTLAELTYSCIQLDKQCRRGPLYPASSVIEPLYASLWNCAVCSGKSSTLALSLKQRLRSFAALMGCNTPPLPFKAKLLPPDLYVALNNAITGTSNVSATGIQEQFEKDPMLLAVAAVRAGLHFPHAIELMSSFKDCIHLPSGLSLLGLACIHSHVELAKKLLEAGFDMHLQNEFYITAFLAICYSDISPPSSVLNSATGMTPTEAEAEEAFEMLQNKQVDIAQAFISRCDFLDSIIIKEYVKRCSDESKRAERLNPVGKKENEKSQMDEESKDRVGNPQVLDLMHKSSVPVLQVPYRNEDLLSHRRNRNKLLMARTHKLLGSSGLLHLAAVRRKWKLVSQLLAAGCVVDDLNAEGATALHMAALCGCEKTVNVLLDHGANVDAQTLRGETPLMVAAYSLNVEICRLLVKRGATLDIKSTADGVNVLHTLAIGTCRLFVANYKVLSMDDDMAMSILSGLNEVSLNLQVYSKTPNWLGTANVIDSRLPDVSTESMSLFCDPKTMLQRLRKATAAATFLTTCCKTKMYEDETKSGFNPYGILLELWNVFSQKRGEVLRNSNVQLAALSESQNSVLEEGWKAVLHSIFHLAEILKPVPIPQSVQETGEHRQQTPRTEDLEELERSKMMRDAPWLFPNMKPNTARYTKHVKLANDIEGKTAGSSQSEGTAPIEIKILRAENSMLGAEQQPKMGKVKTESVMDAVKDAPKDTSFSETGSPVSEMPKRQGPPKGPPKGLGLPRGVGPPKSTHIKKGAPPPKLKAPA